MTNIVAKKTIFFTIKTSLFRPATSADVYSFKFVEHTHEKRGASSVPGPRFEGLRITLSVQPSNAESPTLMYVMTHYINNVYEYYTSKGRSRCFVFDRQMEVAKFSKRQTQSVQKTPLYVCVPPH